MLNQNTLSIQSAQRRGLFGRLAGTLALGLAGLTATPAATRAAIPGSDAPAWPGKLKGRHRQVVDAVEVNRGFPLAFAYTFLLTNPGPGAAAAAVVLRHGAFPIALNNAMWEKYKIGAAFKVEDPETKALAIKNPFLDPKPGVLPVDGMALDRLLAQGVAFGACNVALLVQSKMLAAGAGMSVDAAAKEWAANIVPGIALIPAGTWGVNRAQEAGFTYCAGS